MAWDRRVIMDVGRGGTGLRISDLNVSFDIERSADITNNYAKFIVYNAKEETRNKILSKGNNIIFQAGYKDEGNISTIFIGTISESTTKKDGVNWITELEAIDFGNNKQALSYDTISVSYKEKTALTVVVNDIATLLGVPVSGLQNVNVFLNNGFNFVGSRGNLIKKVDDILRANGVGFYFDSSEMVLYRKGNQDSTFGIVQVTLKNGLVGSVEKTTNENKQDEKDSENTITFSCLLNPKIKPRAIISLKQTSISGLFVVKKVNFSGDNFGGDFLCKVECEA